MPGPRLPVAAAATTTARYANPLLSGVMSSRIGRNTSVTSTVPPTAMT